VTIREKPRHARFFVILLPQNAMPLAVYRWSGMRSINSLTTSRRWAAFPAHHPHQLRDARRRVQCAKRIAPYAPLNGSRLRRITLR
jgi:hypothetical protein